MATILAAWEIGDGHGHVRNLLATASMLRAAGHQVVFVIPGSQVSAIQLVERAGYPVERFVVMLHPSTNQYLTTLTPYRAASYLDIMGMFAFSSADRLAPIFSRYTSIIKQNCIDAIIAETAPVAMFAAKVARIPCIGIGTSFGLPEFSEGFTSYPQLDQFALTPIFSDDALRSVSNCVASASFASMSEAIAPARIVPFCYPSLDHYGQLRSMSSRGVGPVWRLFPQLNFRERQRTGFAYLQSSYPAINELVSAIRKSGIPFRVYVRNGKFASAGNMTVLNSFDLEEELLASSFIVHHGSAGLGQTALSAGIAQVCFPYHIENTNNAYRFQMLGVSKAIGHEQSSDFLQFLLEDEDNRSAAASVIAAQLDAHSREFKGARVAATAVDDLL